MTTLQSALTARLTADAALTAAQPGGLGFTVWDRWLKPTGPGSTPGAFDPTQGGRLRRNIVVMDGGESAWPGRQPGGDGRRWDSFPQTYVFAEAHANGKGAAYSAIARIERLLTGWETVIDASQRVTFRLDNVLALEDSEAFPGNVTLIARWRATSARALVPA